MMDAAGWLTGWPRLYTGIGIGRTALSHPISREPTSRAKEPHKIYKTKTPDPIYWCATGRRHTHTRARNMPPPHTTYLIVLIRAGRRQPPACGCRLLWRAARDAMPMCGGESRVGRTGSTCAPIKCSLARSLAGFNGFFACVYKLYVI